MEKVTRGLREAMERIQRLDRENVSLKEDGKDLVEDSAKTERSETENGLNTE